MTADQLKLLEDQLWTAADQLRANSKLTATEYSFPVLGLIFLRHVYATSLYGKTGTVSLAQLSLGHKTEKQTQDYLSSFGNKRVDHAAEDLFSDF